MSDEPKTFTIPPPRTFKVTRSIEGVRSEEIVQAHTVNFQQAGILYFTTIVGVDSDTKDVIVACSKFMAPGTWIEGEELKDFRFAVPGIH